MIGMRTSKNSINTLVGKFVLNQLVVVVGALCAQVQMLKSNNQSAKSHDCTFVAPDQASHDHSARSAQFNIVVCEEVIKVQEQMK